MATATAGLTATELKKSEALEIVKKYAYGGTAAALIPIPLVDLAAVLALQLAMARKLAELYEVEFVENAARSLIISLVGLGTSYGTFPILNSLVKVVPVMGQLSGAVSSSVLGGASTYAVGRVLIQHFDSGGTFLTLDPEKVRDFYEEALESGQKVPERTRPHRP